MVSAPTPTLAKIKNSASETEARALLYIAVCEVCDFFNVGKNMTDTQIALTVDLILESFWHLKLEEIKYCFRRAMTRERLFDRLDGNIIIGWLREYDTERTEESMRLSDREADRDQFGIEPSQGAMSWEAYVARLWDLALYADPDAIETLSTVRLLEAAQLRNPDAAERRRNDFAYLLFLQQHNQKLQK